MYKNTVSWHTSGYRLGELFDRFNYLTTSAKKKGESIAMTLYSRLLFDKGLCYMKSSQDKIEALALLHLIAEKLKIEARGSD